MFKHVQNSSDLPTRQLKIMLSHLGQIENMKNREFIVDSHASLHMMSKSELTSGEKDTITRSKELIVITTAIGEAVSTEDATVYVNDLDVFVTMMLLEDFTGSATSGFIMQRDGQLV